MSSKEKPSFKEKLKSFFFGKPIEESANLKDFVASKWCLYLYIIFAGTYWYFEIGIPHWDGPKEDFNQLMQHDALIKLTVAFSAAMGLIALLHRSIVSDHQIKQQKSTDIISNYYKISEHINTNANELIINSNRRLGPSKNFPYGIMKNLFPSAVTGNYSLSDDVIGVIHRDSKIFDGTAIQNPRPSKENIFTNIEKDDHYRLLLMDLLHPIFSDPDTKENLDYPFEISKERINQSIKTLSANICVRSKLNTSQPNTIYQNIKKTAVQIQLLYDITQSINNLIHSIPLGVSKDISHIDLSLTSISKLLRNIDIFIFEFEETTSMEDVFFEDEARLYDGIEGLEFHDHDTYKNTFFFIIYVFCCYKTGYRNLSNYKCDIPYSIKVIDSLKSLNNKQKEDIKSHIREYLR